jgi:competence protein ComEC
MVLMPILALGAALRLSRWPRFALGLGTVAFFVVLTGAEPSVLRAGVMAGLALLGGLLGRPRSSGSVLAGAVVALVGLDPTLVWSVGFQLSVAATAGMVALATPIAERLRLLRDRWRWRRAPLAAQAGHQVLLFWFHELPLSTHPRQHPRVPVVAPAMLLGLLAAGGGCSPSRSGARWPVSRSSRCATWRPWPTDWRVPRCRGSPVAGRSRSCSGSWGRSGWRGGSARDVGRRGR